MTLLLACLAGQALVAQTKVEWINVEEPPPPPPPPGKKLVVMEDEEEVVAEEETFSIVEESPEYPGGQMAMNRFIATNVVYPPVAVEAGIQGKVYVQFVVEKDGSIGEVKVIRGIGGGCDREAVRVVKSMPKWKPGTQRGKPVRVRFTLPVNFTLR